jgi:hypothetical protein
MKRHFSLLAVGFIALVLSACNGSMPTLTFQQQVALACSDGTAAINIMTDDGLFTGGALNTLNVTVTPAFNKVCAAGATVTTPNLNSLTADTLPLLKTLVSASNLQPQAKNDANVAIDLVAFAINTAVALAPAAVPTAASTPLAGAPITAPPAAPIAASAALVS